MDLHVRGSEDWEPPEESRFPEDQQTWYEENAEGQRELSLWSVLFTPGCSWRWLTLMGVVVSLTVVARRYKRR